MSLKPVNTTLAGCNPSMRYVPELILLQRELEDGSLGVVTTRIHEIVSIPGFWMHGCNNEDYAPVLKSDDGYGWYCARMFICGNGGFVILFPWSGDRRKRDGSESDRLIQIYEFGNHCHVSICKVLKEMTEWIVDYKEKYGTPMSVC
jgi:hypothetical protein